MKPYYKIAIPALVLFTMLWACALFVGVLLAEMTHPTYTWDRMFIYAAAPSGLLTLACAAVASVNVGEW